jgi:hypothetical protein
MIDEKRAGSWWFGHELAGARTSGHVAMATPAT